MNGTLISGTMERINLPNLNFIKNSRGTMETLMLLRFKWVMIKAMFRKWNKLIPCQVLQMDQLMSSAHSLKNSSEGKIRERISLSHLNFIRSSQVTKEEMLNSMNMSKVVK